MAMYFFTLTVRIIRFLGAKDDLQLHLFFYLIFPNNISLKAFKQQNQIEN